MDSIKMMQTAIDEIIKSVKYMIDNAMNKTTKSYDAIVQGRNADGTYEVKFNGKSHNIKAFCEYVIPSNTMVKVIVPQGNMNVAYILPPSGKGSGGGGEGAVKSVNGQTGDVVLNKGDIGLGNVPNVTTDNQIPAFTEATQRSNIASGDTLSTLFGKIMKWFADLKTVAFTGSYNDLTDKPEFTSSVTSVNNKTGDVVLTKTDIGLGNVANVLQYSEENIPPKVLETHENDTQKFWRGTQEEYQALKDAGQLDPDTFYIVPSEDSGTDGYVVSVNGKSGVVSLDADDVGALPISGGTLTGNRPIGFSTPAGQMVITGSSGGWVTGINFNGNAGTSLGGFQAYGSGDTLNYEFVGGTYENPNLKIQPNGNVSARGALYESGQRVYSPNNKPTAVDVGAAPAGFGLGTPVAPILNGADLDDYKTTGFFGSAGTSEIASWLNKPTGWNSNEAVLIVYGLGTQSHAYSVQELIERTNGVRAVRSCKNNVWQPWEWVNPIFSLDVSYRTTDRWRGAVVYKKVTATGEQWSIDEGATWKSASEYMGAAPAGFGLGVSSPRMPTSRDANDAVLAGWWQCDVNTPTSNWWDIFVAVSAGAEYAVHQFAFDRYGSYSSNGVCYLKRSKAGNGSWGEWEWVNPPMAVGVEYRTTERHLGKPVYTMLYPVGKLTETIGTSRFYPFGESVATNAHTIVGLDAYLTNSQNGLGGWTVKMPYYTTNNGVLAVGASFSGAVLFIYNNGGWENYYGFVKLKYTKLVD